MLITPLASMKLIMHSSFIVKKLGRLGIPAAMKKILAAANHPKLDEAAPRK